MFNFELLFLHGFSLKNREILNKAPQEYDDFFGEKNVEKNAKTIFKKTCLGCLLKSSFVSKNLSQKKTILEKGTF